MKIRAMKGLFAFFCDYYIYIQYFFGYFPCCFMVLLIRNLTTEDSNIKTTLGKLKNNSNMGGLNLIKQTSLSLKIRSFQNKTVVIKRCQLLSQIPASQMCLVRPKFLNYSVPPSDVLVTFEFEYGCANIFLEHLPDVHFV